MTERWQDRWINVFVTICIATLFLTYGIRKAARYTDKRLTEHEKYESEMLDHIIDLQIMTLAKIDSTNKSKQ